MKKNLLTFVLLATVAVGGAYAGHTKTNVSSSKKVLDNTYYENPGCTPVVCGDYNTEECSTLELFKEGCIEREFSPIGNRKAE